MSNVICFYDFTCYYRQNSSSGVVEGCDGKSQISRVRSFLLAYEVSVHSPRSLKINKNGFKINKK